MGVLDILSEYLRKPVWRVDTASIRHAGQIAALHSASFARGWSAQEIEVLMQDRNVIVDILRSEAGSQVIDGFSLSRVAADEAELLSIAVDPKWRGKKGSAPLLARQLARVRGAGARRVVLEVDEANTPAIRLYRSFGFEEVGKRPAYYTLKDGRTANALIMARDLG